ncbi:MAG: MFS transporter, partial [Stackebrandtia sp.]
MRNPFAIRAEPRLARARLGVFGYFGTCGLVFGMWVAQLPALDERMHLGTARIGTALLLIAAGALAAMPVAGRLCDRLDSRRVARVAGPVSALSLLGPALASDYGVLLVFGAVFGVGCGMLEVSMNVNSVEVEARYGRPIVSAFHGAWSLGGAIGGALTAAGLHAGVDARAMLVAAAVSCPVFYLLAGR